MDLDLKTFVLSFPPPHIFMPSFYGSSPFLSKVHKELIASNSQCSNKDNKLLEVHFTISVFVQVPHDLLNHSGIISSLKEK